MKTRLIRQPAGLGDIFVCLKIRKILSEQGWVVFWPVIKQYNYIKDYIFIKNVYFVQQQQMFPGKQYYINRSHGAIRSQNFIYYPLQDSTHYDGSNSVFYSKYMMAGYSFKDWKNYFQYKRNFKKQSELKQILQINDQKYALINKTYRALPNTLQNRKIFQREKEQIKKIYIKIIQGYNIFDWTGVIQNAEIFSSVDTSICYIAQKYSNRKRLQIYKRNELSEVNYNFYKLLYSKNWKYFL